MLEVGSGSGYQTAILAELAARVVSIERHPPLAERARCLLEHLGYVNVTIHIGDGSSGFPSEAPYDRILVAAGAPDIPQPLLDQLASKGRLVIPVGTAEMQRLKTVHKDEGGDIRIDDVGECIFVPLVGEHGWEAITRLDEAL